MASRAGLGVDWHLPDPRGGYRKRPFATTTPASAFLIRTLAEDGLTWQQIADRIIFDPEAWTVARGFVDAGFGNQRAAKRLG